MNTLPNIRSRKFLITFLRERRLVKTSPHLRAALGLVIWAAANAFRKTDRISAFRSECFITGRSRGVTQRYGVARTKIKELASEAKFSGVRKSSW